MSNDTVVGPQKTEIQGIESYATYLKAMSLIMPDGIFEPSEVIIRNTISGSRIRTCTIHAKVSFDCTAVYELLLQSKTSESVTPGTETSLIQSIKLRNTVDKINLTENRHRIEKVEVSATVNKNYEFVRGNVLKNKIKVIGSGSMIFYLNDDMKIYLQDFRLIEKKVEYL